MGEKESLSNPLVPQNRSYFSPQAWKAMSEMANVFIKSGSLPKHINNAHVLMVVLQAGRELGMQPMESITNLYIINGKVAMQGTAMLKQMYQSGVQIEIKEETDTRAVVEFSGLGRKPYASTFTIEDAKKANLLSKGGPWIQYPKMMLRWRAISAGARFFCPDVLQGAYLVEELESIPKIDPAKPGDVNKTLANGGRESTHTEVKPTQVEPKPTQPPPTETKPEPAIDVTAKTIETAERIMGDDTLKITKEDMPP